MHRAGVNPALRCCLKWREQASAMQMKKRREQASAMQMKKRREQAPDLR